MTTRLTRAVEGLAATLLTVALLAGPPWLLTTFVGPPLPASWPDLDTLRQLATTGVTDTFVITTLAVIIWIAWAQLAVAIVVETAAAIRRSPPIRLPLLPGTQPLAARLVAATLLLATLAQPRPLAAAPLELATATTVAVVVDDRPAAAEPSVATVTPTVATRTITIGERDSWWSLAETHLGDGLRWRELRELNVGRTLADGTTITAATDQLPPGATLAVPATGHDEYPPDHADGTDDTDGAGEPADAGTALLEDGWEVQPGDHFWHIADATLTQTWGRTPTDGEIVAYWHTLIEANRHRLAPPGDPDLIFPGQHFELPTPPSHPASAPGENEVPHASAGDDAGAVTQGPTPPRTAEPPTLPADPDPQANREGRAQREESQRAVPEVPIPDSETSAREASGLEQVRPGEAAAADVAGPEPARSATGWEHALTSHDGAQAADGDRGPVGTALTFEGWSRLAAGVAAAGLAAAGIIALVRRHRRLALQQRPLGTRLPTPAPDTLDHLHRLELAAADEETTLAGLSELLTTIPAGARPALVVLTDAGTVRLLFADDTDPGPPAEPWHDAEAKDGEPAGWTARLGERGPRRSIGLPLLVTLGRTDDQTILANLASMPTLDMCGHPDDVATALHAATFEVATSRTAGPLTVAVTGAATHPALDQAHTTDDPAAALDTARDQREQDIIDDDRTVLLLVAHAGTTLPNLEDTHDDPFVGVLRAADTLPQDRWAVTIQDHDTATLHLPDGGQVPLQRPELAPDAICNDLDRYSQHVPDPDCVTSVDDQPDGGRPAPDDRPTPTAPPADGSVIDLTNEPTPVGPSPAPSSNGHRHNQTPLTAALQVRILGPVDAHRDGEPITGLAPLTLQILVYLATHRDGVSAERLDDVIWNGQAAAPNSQRLRSALTKLRDSLGDGPDGNPLVPRRRHRSDPVRLDAAVVTDLDLAIGHLEQARTVQGTERLAQLDRALTYVRGEPFAGWPLSWTSEIAERAIAQLQDAAAAAAAGHRRRGQHEAAEHAIITGLKLCDPNETLYIEWARLEASKGRHDQIARIWQRLQAAYDTHADETAGHVGAVTASTIAAFETLRSNVNP